MNLRHPFLLCLALTSASALAQPAPGATISKDTFSVQPLVADTELSAGFAF